MVENFGPYRGKPKRRDMPAFEPQPVTTPKPIQMSEPFKLAPLRLPDLYAIPGGVLFGPPSINNPPGSYTYPGNDLIHGPVSINEPEDTPTTSPSPGGGTGPGPGTPTIHLSKSTFVEDSPEGTSIGVLSTTGGTGTYTFTLNNSAGGKVKIVGTALQVGPTVSSAGSFSIGVHAAGDGTADQNFTITATVLGATGEGWAVPEYMGFGINTHLGRANDYAGAPITEAETTEAMATMGTKYIRQGVEWHIVEKVAGVYDFSLYTNQFAGLGSDVTPLITLGYGNPVHTASLPDYPWTVWPPRTAPELAAFKEYCRQTALVFGPSIPYEIWNEANADGFWGGEASIAEYCAVYDAGAQGIREAHPDAFIMTSGVTPGAGSMSGYIDATEWVLGVLAGVTEPVDAVAWHFYTTGDYAPWDPSGWNYAYPDQGLHSPEDVIRWVPEVRTALGIASDMPILNTECGYCNANGAMHYGDDRQGILEARLLLSSFISGIQGMTIIYDMINDAVNIYDPQGSYGQYNFDFTIKPGATAIGAITRAFKDATGTITHTAGGIAYPGQIYTIMIPKADRMVCVAWSNGIPPLAHTVTFPSAVTKSKAVDVYGVTQDKATSGSTVTVKLCNGYGPIIIEANGPGTAVPDRDTINLLKHPDDLGHADWQRFNLTTFDTAGFTLNEPKGADFFGTTKACMVDGEAGSATAGDSFLFRQADITTGVTNGTTYRFEVDVLHHPYLAPGDVLITGGDFVLRAEIAGLHDVTVHNKRGWQRIKMTFVANADATQLDLKIFTPTAHVWIANPLLTAQL